jgi:hypothetical protein
MDVDFVADEMESSMEVDPDPSDPLGIPNMATGAQNWTCTGADNYFKKQKFCLISIYYTRLAFS